MIYTIDCTTLGVGFANHYNGLSQAKAAAARHFKSLLWDRSVRIIDQNGEAWETTFRPNQKTRWGQRKCTS